MSTPGKAAAPQTDRDTARRRLLQEQGAPIPPSPPHVDVLWDRLIGALAELLQDGGRS